MSDKKITRNSIIDGLLKEGATDTKLIVDKVLETFPEAKPTSLRRQVYSRRNAMKPKAVPTPETVSV